MLMTGDECSILFGESKHALSTPDSLNDWTPVAKRRGVPPNMAHQTTQAVNEALQNDETVMSTWGFTHISYDEIALID